jgi:polyhydroxyalkanoate synthesis regulator phasin
MVDHADRKSVEEILEEMDVPRKADIEALSQKITELAKKIDALRES